MPRRFSPLNTFTRQALIRVLGDDGVVGPLESSTGVQGTIVAATTRDEAASASAADPSWTGTLTYIGNTTDPDTGDVYGVYQLKIAGGVIGIDACDAAFPEGTDPYFVVHLDNAVHAVERLLYSRGRPASLL